MVVASAVVVLAGVHEDTKFFLGMHRINATWFAVRAIMTVEKICRVVQVLGNDYGVDNLWADPLDPTKMCTTQGVPPLDTFKSLARKPLPILNKIYHCTKTMTYIPSKQLPSKPLPNAA
eukprot:5855128-Amphidinium_carterae.2